MYEIKLVDRDTDLSKLKPLDWDVVINNRPYYVVKINGYVHTIGGHWGENDYWAYPRDEKPSYKNLIEFTSDEVVCWGIKYEPKIQTHYKYGESEARSIGGVTITRNGKDFFTIGGGLHYGIDKARVLIDEFKEHPINTYSIDFDKKVIGRKVWWRSQPGIITHWVDGQACVIIEPDGIPNFSVPKEFDNDYSIYYTDEPIKADILDKHIWWFRE